MFAPAFEAFAAPNDAAMCSVFVKVMQIGAAAKREGRTEQQATSAALETLAGGKKQKPPAEVAGNISMLIHTGFGMDGASDATWAAVYKRCMAANQ
jgi:hypothetical protein